MWLLFLEALLALVILVFIVWWTMAPVKKREDQARADSPDASSTPERKD